MENRFGNWLLRQLGAEFTASDIIKKVHKTNPDVPEISVRSHVIEMAPNHQFSGHWLSARNNHPYFFYLGNGKFKWLKPTVKPKKPTYTSEK